jgi:uncharacterized secreted protein with C-terminal beta-propeller domain
LVALVACLPGGAGDLDFERGELAQFKDCEELRGELQRRALREAESRSYLAVTGGTFTRAGFVAGEPGGVSPTNNQERGVDEADIFKWDDGAVFALHGTDLVIADSTGVLSSTRMTGQPYELHVDGPRVLVMAHSDRGEVKEHFASAPDRDAGMPVVEATVLDVSDRSAPKIVRQILFEGSIIGTRRIGDSVHIVSKATLGGPAVDEEPDGEEHWLTQRTRTIEAAGIDQWLPSYYDKTNGEVRRSSCKDTFVSGSGAGDDAVTVYTLSLSGSASDSVETTTIIGDGAELYASPKSLVVALPGNETVGESFQEDRAAPVSSQVTWVHRFSLANGEPRYRASGRVKGWILNQFSISEHKGVIRVATMTGDQGSDNAASHVFILRESNKEKKLLSGEGSRSNFLKEVGAVRDIAVGEDLYAARFQGDVGYLVTFRETDPLWTLDLSNPENPRLLGELMVPGYSTYLHPIEGGKLLAVGRGDRREGGIKLSLFDVSDLARPTVVEEEVVGDERAVSEALEDHRAFNWMPQHRLLALPVRTARANGLSVYEVSGTRGLKYQGRVTHHDLSESGRATIRRSLTVGDQIWVYSSAGITVSDVSSLETLVAIDLPDAALVR